MPDPHQVGHHRAARLLSALLIAVLLAGHGLGATSVRLDAHHSAASLLSNVALTASEDGTEAVVRLNNADDSCPDQHPAALTPDVDLVDARYVARAQDEAVAHTYGRLHWHVPVRGPDPVATPH